MAVLRLDLTGENAQTLGILRGALKPYRGKTRVEIVNFTGLSWWRSRGVDNAQVFYCPPLVEALRHVLPESRIALLDSEGRAVKM